MIPESKVPAEVQASMLWTIQRFRTSMLPDDLLRTMLSEPKVQDWLASRLTHQEDEARRAALEEASLDRSAMEFASTMRSSEDEPGWKWWASYCTGDPEALAMAQAYHGALSQKGDANG